MSRRDNDEVDSASEAYQAEEVMWKPGSKRPAPEGKDNDNGEKNGGKKPRGLSAATRNMRFMRSTKSESAPLPQPPAPMAQSASIKPVERLPPTNKANEDVQATVSASDLYGNSVGRRSFGRFNPAVEASWNEQQKHQSHSNKRKQPGKVSDEELLRRYSRKQEGPSGRAHGRRKRQRRR